VIKEKLPIDGTFVDIGSNIGDHSLFAAHVAKRGKVLAFEPIPDLYKQCLESESLAAKNNRSSVTFFNLACGEKDDTLTIFSPEGNIGGSSFLRNKGKREEVSVIKADKLLQEEKRIDMIKIDVEGFEYAALCGLEKTIKQHLPLIILELSPSLYNLKEETAFDEEKILRFLKENSYAVQGIDEPITYTNDPITIYPIPYEQVNLLFTPLPKVT
jgi:FkbM family methyltransferase